VTIMRGSIVAMLALGAVGAVSVAARDLRETERIDPKAGCRANPALVAPCFEVHGRAFASNGAPSMRVAIASTKRLLGVVPSENEIAPRCLRSNVTFHSDVTGRFVACPFTPQRSGAMQMVCIEAVRDATVRASGGSAPSSQPPRKLEDCLLERAGN